MLHILQTGVDKLEDLLDTAKTTAVAGEDVPGKMFLPAVAVYKQLYEDLAVKTTEEYDAKLSSTADEEVQRVLSKLESVEADWNKFLTTVDPEVKESDRKCVTEGEVIATPVQLVNARSGNQTDLESLLSSSDSSYLHLVLLRYLSWPPWRDHVAKLEREITLLSEAGCKVVLVSFGTTRASNTWLAETSSQLDMFVDAEKSLYKMLGQVRSTSQVYNIDTIKYVAVMNIHGQDLPALIEGDVQDDLQMGGNMTIKCKTKEVVMAYPSKGATDRPSVKQILKKFWLNFWKILLKIYSWLWRLFVKQVKAQAAGCFICETWMIFNTNIFQIVTVKVL